MGAATLNRTMPICLGLYGRAMLARANSPLHRIFGVAARRKSLPPWGEGGAVRAG